MQDVLESFETLLALEIALMIFEEALQARSRSLVFFKEILQAIQEVLESVDTLPVLSRAEVFFFEALQAM